MQIKIEIFTDLQFELRDYTNYIFKSRIIPYKNDKYLFSAITLHSNKFKKTYVPIKNFLLVTETS